MLLVKMISFVLPHQLAPPSGHMAVVTDLHPLAWTLGVATEAVEGLLITEQPVLDHVEELG